MMMTTMMMKRCELCKSRARVHCESDQASLCWTCDAAVHSANFLVARHSRSLLCRLCHEPTQWCVSGGKVTSVAIAVCEQCSVNRRKRGDGGEQEEVVEENQLAPPLEVDCSSSSDEESAICGDTTSTRKRLRSGGAASSDLPLDRYEDRRNRAPPSDTASGVVDPLLSAETAPLQKLQKTESGQDKVRGSGLMDALRRFHQEETSSGRGTVEIRTIRGPSI